MEAAKGWRRALLQRSLPVHRRYSFGALVMALELFYTIKASVKEQWSIHKLGPPYVQGSLYRNAHWAVYVQAKGKEGVGFEDLLLYRLSCPPLQGMKAT